MAIRLPRIASRKPLSTNGTHPASRGPGNQAIGTRARPAWGSPARYSPICRPMSYHDTPTLAARPASAMSLTVASTGFLRLTSRSRSDSPSKDTVPRITASMSAASAQAWSRLRWRSRLG